MHVFTTTRVAKSLIVGWAVGKVMEAYTGLPHVFRVPKGLWSWRGKRAVGLGKEEGWYLGISGVCLENAILVSAFAFLLPICNDFLVFYKGVKVGRYSML